MTIIRKVGNTLTVFTGSEVLPNGMRMSPDTAATYAAAALAVLGLYVAVPFAVPPGKVITGGPRYVWDTDHVNEVYDVMDEPLPIAVEPQRIAAAFNVNVADSDITNIDGPFNIAAAAYVDVGVYWLFFAQSQPDSNYFAVISGGAPVLLLTEHGEDFFAVEAKESISGAHIDVLTFSVQIYRIQQ